MKTRHVIAAGAVLLAGCSKPNATPADTSRAATAAASVGADSDKNVAGGSIPSGYVARTDRSDAAISGAKYTASGDGWEVITGPAHILYATKDLGNGNFTASATFEQLEAPAHPEAFGIFIGGMHLDRPNIAYTYFEVRGTGEVLVKLRDGKSTRDIIPWTANADVPKQDASGKATYTLSATVTNNAILFSVNGKQVASVSKAGLPTDGIAGIRVNHNLHVKVTPISIKAP
ncbi:MAG TPA: hypothetical protein VFC35_00815 [Gemmatimonadaceae bacterium]|nr:hypothetical protein [Gemmatimonadaceae bacterium]